MCIYCTFLGNLELQLFFLICYQTFAFFLNDLKHFIVISVKRPFHDNAVIDMVLNKCFNTGFLSTALIPTPWHLYHGCAPTHTQLSCSSVLFPTKKKSWLTLLLSFCLNSCLPIIHWPLNWTEDRRSLVSGMNWSKQQQQV